jgi:hypothetical protein
MDIQMSDSHLYLSMESYITKAVGTMDFISGRAATTPMTTPIDHNSALLDSDMKRRYMTMVGVIGWIANTARPDVSVAFSRLGQYMANPNQSALDAAEHTLRYLRGTADHALSVPLHCNKDISDMLTDIDPGNVWTFYTDSDHAGNTDPSSKRRSQNGFAALCNGAVVAYHSKANSVACASPLIGEAHADVSSAAAEVYAAGNAASELLYLSYVAEGAGVPISMPMVLQMDNSACLAFANNSALKTTLKHIDCRQEWVRVLRDKAIVEPRWVPTADNLADIFTKLLPTPTFLRLRDTLLTRKQIYR